MKSCVRWLVSFMVVLGLALSACAAPGKSTATPALEKPAVEKPATATSPAALTREQRLIEGAKKEGEVSLYTMSWYRGPMEKAIEAKYPWLKFSVWDGPSGPAVIARLAEEAKIGRSPADVFIGPEPDGILAMSAGILQEYTWPNEGWPRQQPGNKYFMNIISSAFFRFIL